MADSVSLRFGRGDVTFRKSPTEIAVRPARHRARDFDRAVDAITRRGRGRRSAWLGPFEIVAMPEASIARTRDRLARSEATGRPRPVYHTSDDQVPFVPEGTLFLSFREGASERGIEDVLRRHGLGVVSVSGGFYTVRAENADMVEVAAELQREPMVAVAEPDLITPRQLLDFLPNDPRLARQWHLENRGDAAGLVAGADARVVAAWRRLGHLGAPEAVVAVIDDGFDLTHPDFQDKAVDPRDFIRGGDDVSPEPDPTSPTAGDWHGTACAGVALARAQGGEIVGAAPNARLIPVRMAKELSPGQVEQWFDYVTEKGAWVVSCSWNAAAKVYPLPERVAQAIHRCATGGRDGKGAVVVFAAGNNGKDVNDPPRSQNGFATHPGVLAVAASTSRDQRATYSARGREIAVCAPSSGLGGLFVTTADVTGAGGYDPGDYHDGFEGTSSACPLVAGICALVLGANPALTAADVRQIVRATARRIGAETDYQNGHSRSFGHGCVNAEAAVDLALKTVADGATLVALRAGIPPVA
jgi:subtilisin family serine protease